MGMNYSHEWDYYNDDDFAPVNDDFTEKLKKGDTVLYKPTGERHVVDGFDGEDVYLQDHDGSCFTAILEEIEIGGNDSD